MEIIQPGKYCTDKKRLYGFEVKCARCECKYIVNLNEVDAQPVGYSWLCPECGAVQSAGGFGYNEYAKPIFDNASMF